MSTVTNAILVSATISALVEEANRFFGPGYGFVSVEDPRLPIHWYGGSKGLECDIAIGAFNHLDLDGLVHHLDTLEIPCQLMILEQDEAWFRVITFRGDSKDNPDA